MNLAPLRTEGKINNNKTDLNLWNEFTKKSMAPVNLHKMYLGLNEASAVAVRCTWD